MDNQPQSTEDAYGAALARMSDEAAERDRFEGRSNTTDRCSLGAEMYPTEFAEHVRFCPRCAAADNQSQTTETLVVEFAEPDIAAVYERARKLDPEAWALFRFVENADRRRQAFKRAYAELKS